MRDERHKAADDAKRAPMKQKHQTMGIRIKEARKAMNLSQQALANLVAVDQSTVALWEMDRTTPREDTLAQLATVLFLSPEFLRYGNKPPESTGYVPRSVPVVGFVMAGNEVKHIGKKLMQETPSPPQMDPDQPEPTAALVVRGNSMWPVYRDGDILFYSEQGKGKPSDMLGTECVVQVDGGATLVKRVMSGSRRGLYTLASYNAPEIHDVAISWCAPIVWVRRNLQTTDD
jgi:phage repressor protein C with HTH and peptisase S24 domain